MFYLRWSRLVSWRIFTGLEGRLFLGGLYFTIDMRDQW